MKLKARDIVAEIKASSPDSPQGARRWFERIPDELVETCDAIHAAWHDGEFGSRKRTAARSISAKLRALGIVIGEQGVLAWLEMPRKS